MNKENFLYERRISLFALEFKLELTSASNKRLSREAVEAPWCSFTSSSFFFSRESIVCIAKASDPTRTRGFKHCVPNIQCKSCLSQEGIFVITLCIVYNVKVIFL